MFMIPASGDEPLTFAAKNLPAGLTLDAKTGLITGIAESRRPHRGRRSPSPTRRQGDRHDSRSLAARSARVDAAARMEFVERLGQHGDGRAREASADGMVKSGLHRQGYTYINIDDVWEGG